MPDREDPRTSSPVTLRLWCRECGEPVTVQHLPGDQPHTRAVWHCPHQTCGKGLLFAGDVTGEVLTAWPGHGPDPGVD